MKNIASFHSLAALALLSTSGLAFAHDNHGLLGSHWHVTDVWGFVALGGAIAVAIWLSRGDR
ncbi:hypothetical protein [Rhodoferax sp.]|jgi:hypothetical protein|uniref:hypothetical protein n=1 Tax=Rhodoferax sp. TaxID=50421 RepID=UPI002720E2C5|nr:hypothetical protein [Rhodoferax sp.]MDO9144985.1 hypothetical protein [Rhodoferax sp.]MDP1528665.1 hypothetical protein [Rhodoferax sp.]MDP1942448.1 hypothetical protein [Rhodoferax sp.]MDP2441918.1 hypothetical protein [Rhodoferax sp.]MDP3865821.1 hypothetical protein [Rhodoferax sp.]